MVLDKFIPPYIDFVEQYLNISDHHFIIFSDNDSLSKYQIKNRANIILINQKFHFKIFRLFYIVYKLQFSRKIFIHGLWVNKLNIILSFMFWNLKKYHLAIWGGDLYAYKFDKKDKYYFKKEKYRKFVFRHMGYIIPVVYGDYELAKKWYNTKAKMCEPFMYVQFYEYYVSMPLKYQNDIVNIQVGNSATDTNHHIECFKMLQKFKNINIYSPLSYGDMDYANIVINDARDRFGDRFFALQSFMEFDEYVSFLNNIDIAIFKQNRQQGMGNIFVLLALGKKVYLDSSTTHYEFLINLGFKVFDISDFNIEPISALDSMHNKNLLLTLYSKDKQIQNQKRFYV